MVRPCFLILDREHASSISTRKLVVETAKFNVITAYSLHELLETIELFPSIHAIVLDASVKDLPCDDVISTVRAKVPRHSPIIVVQGPNAAPCTGADHYLDSFDPEGLLHLLRKYYPLETAAINERNTQLKREGD